jgi:replicative DNA helicase
MSQMASEIQKLKQEVSLLSVASQTVKFERRGSEYWGCCPLHGEHTPSFAIKLKDGCEVFFCQGCGKGGDVLTFIELRDKCSKKDALEKLKGYSCAPHDGSKNSIPPATFAQNAAWSEEAMKVATAFPNLGDAKPKQRLSMAGWLPKEEALSSNKEALAWLLKERGITEDTAKRMRLGFTKTHKGHVDDESIRNLGWICFPRFDGEDVIAIKMRSIATKAFSQVPGMDAKALFNAEAANALEDLFITEGEFDTCIMEQAGYRALSIPNASSKLTPENKVIMKRGLRVFLVGDNDGGAGNAAMRTLQRELGENTYLIEWPGAKDANQFFKENCRGDVSEFKQRVDELAKIALSTPVEGFTSLLTRLRDASLQSGTDAAGDPRRLHFQFGSLDNMCYCAPGSVVTFYSTYSGTGKTVFTTQAMLHEAERGETVVVYSPEVRDSQYLALVAAQIVGPKRLPKGLDRAGLITPQDYKETMDELSKPLDGGAQMQFYVGHSLPVSDGEKALDFIEMVLRATGATRLVIDTLHRIVSPIGRESVVEAEGRTMRRLEELAIVYRCIIIVIGQSNKEAEDLKEVRKDSHGTLRGNREITDISEAVYLIHRKRNEKAEAAEGVDLLEAETTIILVKGRVQGRTGKFSKMTYKKECSRFYPLTYDPAPGNMSTESGSNQEEELPGQGAL